MAIVNVVAVTTAAQPISAQFNSFGEAADAVCRWSGDPFYLGTSVLLAVYMHDVDSGTRFKHTLQDGRFGRAWRKVYMIDATLAK